MREPPRLLVLYGSQTFTAQEIAERIWRITKALGFRGPVQAMDDFPIQKLIHEEFALFVCATTGHGDEPDNMKRFWKFLLRKNLPTNSLTKLKYGVLGLGDSSYSKFNFAGKKLHKRLMQLGATPLLDIGLCDYQHDLGHEAEMTPWLKQYTNSLKLYFPELQLNTDSKFIPRWKVSLINDGTDLPRDDVTEDIYFAKGIKDHFVDAKLLELEKNIRTTDETHFQDVRLLTFTTKNGTKVDYQPGDVFNIRPRNSKEDIEDLFQIFETHNMDIKPYHRLLVEECHEGPERAAVIGGFSGGANTQSSQDDEYRYAGVEDPKIMITTSREPSARLKMFVKELRLIFPNSQRMNRGGYEMAQLLHACRANHVTDFIIVHEHRGVPDALVVCHLPYGPTASFTLSGVVMRHDIPDLGPMSEQYPHLLFHNFKTDLGLRTMSILKYLFPVPKAESKRVVTFANNDDYISFRQHTYKKAGKDIELTEIGPRFQMKLYEIKLGTLEALDAADTEWALRPYMNTAAKRRFLSPDDGWQDQAEYMPVPDFLKHPLTLYEIAEQYWDLKFYPTQYVFSLLALVSEDKLERDKCIELSTAQGQEDWLNYCRRPRRTVLEVLQDFHKSASKLTIEILFELFSPIKPRSFSIASSSLPSGGQKVELLIAVVKYYSKLKKARLGLASNWLKSLNAGDKVYGWITKGTIEFPKDTSIPLILIGPGTGLAPFRSLIQQRVHLDQADKHTMHLYFGCRYRERDFHCRDELERWAAEGKLTLCCAFSRDQEDKIYVQHKIAEHSVTIRSLILEQNGYIFISGNAKNMPNNVKEALGEAVGPEEVKRLEDVGRLQIETW